MCSNKKNIDAIQKNDILNIALLYTCYDIMILEIRGA